MTDNNELTTIETSLPAFPENGSVFFNMQKFEHCQRIAKMFLSSKMWPDHLRTVGDAMIVLNMADRLNVDPCMLAQCVYIIHGKPGLEAKLIIALINNLRRFEPLQFREDGDLREPKNDSDGMIAYAKDLKSGIVLESTKIDWKMVKGQGWYNKAGSKWSSGLAPLMFRYRSATYFARIHCPEVLLGLQTTDEIGEAVELQAQDNVYQLQQQFSKTVAKNKVKAIDIYADDSDSKKKTADDVIEETLDAVGPETVRYNPWQSENFAYQRAGNYNPGKPQEDWNGFAGYCIEHKDTWENATDTQKQAALSKWQKLYGDDNFPLPMPEEKEEDMEIELDADQKRRVAEINYYRQEMPDHYMSAIETLKSEGKVSTSIPRHMTDDDVTAIQKKVNELIDSENA